MGEVKEFIKTDWKRLFKSAVAGFILGFIVALVASMFTTKDVNGFIMLAIIVGGSVGGYFVLRNNNDFKK